MSRHITRILIAAFCVLTGQQAGAQGFYPDWAYNGAPMSQMLSASYVLQQAGNPKWVGGKSSSGSSSKTGTQKARSAEAARSSSGSEALRFSPSGRSIVPAKLAQGYPAAHRENARKLFEQTLGTYHQIADKLGVARNDLAGAMATFVAGNFMAYHDASVNDADFPVLVAQMREALSEVDALRRAPDVQKQEVFEELAIVGTFMAVVHEGLKQKPNDQLAAKMKSAARDYLRTAMKLDAEKIDITHEGLVLN